MESGTVERVQRFGDGLFVFRICEGEEERDGDGLRLCGGDAAGEVAQFLRRGCGEDFAVAGGAFVDAEAEIFGDQRLDAVEEEVVELGAGLASDFDGVFETCVVTRAVRAPLRSEQRVGADGGAVQEDDVFIG